MSIVNTVPGGVALPTLSNPAASQDILSGKQAINSSGGIIMGNYNPPQSPAYGWVELSVTQSAVYSLSYSDTHGSMDINNVVIDIPAESGQSITIYLYSSVSVSGGLISLYGSKNFYWPARNWDSLSGTAFWVEAANHREAYYATNIAFGYWGNVTNPTIYGTIYYAKKATIVESSAPVVGNIPIKIHLTEHTGNQYKRLPIMG